MKSVGILVFDDVEELDFVGPLEVHVPPPAASARSSCFPSPVRTGAVMNGIRCCSASTEPPGPTRRSCRNT